MRKALVFAAGILIVNMVVAPLCTAGKISLSIDNIVADEFIAGTVKGLPKDDYGLYKVVVYVKTDRWYIHPYADQGEGMSWAAIRPNGKWTIKTVKRSFKANKVAAVLVRKNFPEPNTLTNLGELDQAEAMEVIDLTKSEFKGRL